MVATATAAVAAARVAAPPSQYNLYDKAPSVYENVTRPSTTVDPSTYLISVKVAG